MFGGPAWTWDDETQQYYLHNFLPEQPDLNWWNEEVRDAFDDILRLWFDRGISGFRIDVAHGIVKDARLRDNPLATADDHPQARALGQLHEFNMNRPEVHDLLRRWRAIADGYAHEPILLGETWVPDLRALMAFYGDGTDELHLALNVPFVFATLGAEMRAIVEEEEAAIPERGVADVDRLQPRCRSVPDALVWRRRAEGPRRDRHAPDAPRDADPVLRRRDRDGRGRRSDAS